MEPPRRITSRRVSREMDNTMSPSSPAASSFLDPPLSTKRERQLHPARIASVPRAARTAPARSRFIHHRFQLQRPHLVSCRRGAPSDTIPKSSAYNPDYDASYFDQVFQLIKVLGEGSFGQVVCVKSREDQRMYAVKRVIDPFRSESDRRAKLREVQKHELIPPHSNILEFFMAWEERGRLYIQTELCEQSLASYTEIFHPVPETEVWNYFIDICQAVNHLHAHDLLHMDIKPENILMTKDKICKLGDFGRVFDQKNDKKDVAEEGDSKYLALEILNNPPTKAADIFSVGMTILEIATDMELPSQGESWHHIREGSIPERFFAHVSTELRGHIMHMINIDPNLRPTAKQLIHILSTTIRSRRKHIYVHEVKHKMMDFFFTASCIVLAIVAMLKELWHRFGSAIFFDRFASISQNQPVPRTPVTARLPIQPVDNLDWSYSDEVSENHHHHSYHHHGSYLAPGLPTAHYPENPCPRYRLNFDEGEANSTTSNDSVPGQEHEGTPPGPSSARKSPFRAVHPSGGSRRADETMGASGDWNPELENEFSDSDDEVFCRRGTMTAPPRLPVRSAYRNRGGARKPPPRLNLHLLDSPESQLPSQQPRREKTPSPHRAVGPTPTRRKPRTSFQQRLISNEDSADEM